MLLKALSTDLSCSDPSLIARSRPNFVTILIAVGVKPPSLQDNINTLMFFCQVTIQRDNEQLVSASLGQLNSPSSKPVELHWQQQLEAAQNVMFCKELFSQLAREAVSLQAPIPHMVVGSQITASLFPDIQLIISLCHSTPHAATKQGGNSAPNKSANDHSHVLEHSLHQLLRKVPDYKCSS